MQGTEKGSHRASLIFLSDRTGEVRNQRSRDSAFACSCCRAVPWLPWLLEHGVSLVELL